MINGRFPGDVLIIVVGPFLAVAIALLVGSLIFHAAHWSRGTVIAVCAAVGLCAASALVLLVRRRGRRG